MGDLTKKFDELNTRYFDGKLPKYRVVFGGTASHRIHGYCDNTRRLIRLGSGLSREALHRTLLHEMCHIGCPHHGKRFRAKLRRLEKRGETWAGEEAERYESGLTWNEEMHALREHLDEIARAMVAEERTISLQSLARSLGAELGLTGPELSRRVPWLKAAWRNAIAYAKRYQRIRHDTRERMLQQHRE